LSARIPFVGHGAELQQLENRAPLPGTPLPEQHRPPELNPNHQRYYG
jgi:hypothetical protein